MSRSATSELDAETSIASTYAAGQPIEVLFNPKRPFESTLHREGRSFWLSFVYGGVALSIPMLGALLQHIWN
jgi:hypothetical protein